tara:strand:- start:156 stop:512 length:357 start_codon:yes stop_codon:yes gene_type:complete
MSDDEELSRSDYISIIKNKKKPLFVKFTASWCGPCKKIKQTVDDFLSSADSSKIQYLEIDIDNSIDVYAFLKSKRMVNGVPTLMFYSMSDKDYPPKLSVSTGSIEVVQKFINTMVASI